MARKRKPFGVVRKKKVKRSKPSDDILEDRLSSLPDEILLAILSRLTMKEAATTSVLSHKWEQLWHCYPSLSFEDPKWNLGLGKNYALWMRRERPTLIKRVDFVEHYLGPSIDKFKVIFDLSHKHQSHIDKWVDFAYGKNVKSLHLHLNPHYYPPYWKPYTLQLPLQFRNHNFDTFQSTLKSLCLSCVEVSDEMFQCFPSCFPLLEILRLKRAYNLRNIRSCSSLHLKHLEVTNCLTLQVIDLSVPQLLSFYFKGQPVDLHLRNASSLSVVSVVSVLHRYQLAYTFDSFLTYYSQQLEYLEVQVTLKKELPNLKHLSLYVDTDSDLTLAGWAPLIVASPLLQKLTLKFDIEVVGRKSRRGRAKFDSHPLNCLKTLEIVGFKGCCVDMEFAMYVVENAILLEEVIINPRLPYCLSEKRRLDKMALKGALELIGKLPKTVKLIAK